MQIKSTFLNSSEIENLALPTKKSLFQYFTIIQQFFYYPIEFSTYISNNYTSFQAVKSLIYEDIEWIKIDRYSMAYGVKGYMLEEKIMNIQIPSALYQCNDGSYIKRIFIV